MESLGGENSLNKTILQNMQVKQLSGTYLAGFDYKNMGRSMKW